ncbi:hypothetical protein F25303_813 [Fusarium sp. NRRL 25303]|nr:hypothetical protein F25303_813 [Fusarium sp. NRRL 25303]
MYDYLGCLSSQEEFPSFTEIATASDMTVKKCIEVGAGSQYIGVHRRLSGTEFIADAKCDIRCPGDSTVFCGGDNNAQIRRRRSIPSNFFLTLYRLSASASSASSASLSSTLTPSSPVVTLPTSTAHPTTSNSNAVLTSDDSTTKTSESAVLTDIATATTSNTACITRTTLTDTVTSVTYVTVDTSLSVIITCVPVTLVYSPCGCEHETYPSVDMKTVTSPCSTDASYAKDTITLTVPKACETLTSAGQSAVQYPSGWIWSQTYSGHGSYYLAQPTVGPQTDSGSDNTQPSQVVPVVRPETISQEGKASAGGAKATDRPQKATGEPSSEAGSDGYDYPEALVSQSTTSLHHEQIPAKDSNGLEHTSSSWITHHGNHDASTPTSKTGSTDETAQSNAPSESGAEGSTPMPVSGASRHRCVTWAVVGLAFMFY